jgi:hypothetical protein
MPDWIQKLDWDWNTLATTMNVFLPLFIALLGILAYEKPGVTSGKDPAKKPRKKAAKRNHLTALIWVAFGLSLVCGIVNFIAHTQRRNFDTESVRYHDDKFNDKMVHNRVSAAIALMEYRQKRDWAKVTNSTDGLDAVLGFFDSLGYDWKHGKISADVLHEYFYDDIAGYYQTAATWIAKQQKEDSRTTFDQIKPLFDAVTEIEVKKTGSASSSLVWSEKNFDEWLDSERKLQKP